MQYGIGFTVVSRINAWYYRSVLGAITERDAALQKSGVYAKLSTQESRANAESDAQDITPQHAPIAVINPQLFEEFQQAVAYLFEGALNENCIRF